MTSSKLPKWMEDLDIDAVLTEAARDPAAYALDLYDDFPKLRRFPAGWEAAFIRVLLEEEIKDPFGFKYFCADMLLTMNSQWEGLSDVLEELVDLAPGLMVYDLVFRWGALRDWRLSESLARRVRITYEAMPIWKRAILYLDGHVRRVLKSCARIDGDRSLGP